VFIASILFSWVCCRADFIASLETKIIYKDRTHYYLLRSKANKCFRDNAGIAGSKPTDSMNMSSLVFVMGCVGAAFGKG